MSSKKTDIKSLENTKKLPPLIEYRNITVMRGDRIALDNISLSIDAGENVAILGPNGSGKTSFIKTITRECFPLNTGNEPHLRIFGKDQWNLFELRKLIGVVTSDLVSYCSKDYYTPHEIIISNFFQGLGIWSYNKITPAMEKKTKEVTRLLGISHLANRPMSEISTGEARRVIIGRALVHKPKALLLDEPTASLDLGATYELRQILRKVTASGTSIIMVTHSLPDIIPEIKRVVLIKDGHIFKDGTKEDVLTSKTLSELFGKELELIRRDGYYYLL